MSLQLYKANRFIQRMLDQEIITDAQLEEALALRKTDMAGCDLITIFAALGYLDLGHVCEDIADRFELKRVVLHEREISPKLVRRLTPRIARFYRAIPVEETEDTLTVATDDPTNLNIFDSLSRFVGKAVQPAVATPDEVTEALNRYYPIEH